MVSTPEEITYNSPGLPMTQNKTKKPIARKLLRLFTKIFDVKKRTAIRRVGSAKKKRKGHSKIKKHIKCKLYKWITRHPQVLQSPIYIDCLKVIFDDQT